MSGLTYEQRKRVIFEFLYRKEGGLLRRYKTPEHMNDDALRDEVNFLVEDINRQIPEDYAEVAMNSLMPEINNAIRRRHGATGWPPAKVFIAATDDAVEVINKRRATAEPTEEFSLDPYKIASRRMRTGEPVGESYLWGRQAVELIARGLVDQPTMEGYRLGAFMARKEHYGEEEAIRWEEEAKARHLAAKEAYRHRKDDGRPIDPEILRRMQADLDAAGAAMDRRAQAMRRSA